MVRVEDRLVGLWVCLSEDGLHHCGHCCCGGQRSFALDSMPEWLFVAICGYSSDFNAVAFLLLFLYCWFCWMCWNGNAKLILSSTTIHCEIIFKQPTASSTWYQEKIERQLGACQIGGFAPNRSLGIGCFVQWKCHDLGLWIWIIGQILWSFRIARPLCQIYLPQTMVRGCIGWYAYARLQLQHHGKSEGIRSSCGLHSMLGSPPFLAVCLE